jgi:anti-anti-sigma factor
MRGMSFYMAAQPQLKKYLGKVHQQLLFVTSRLKGGIGMAITTVEVNKSVDACGVAVVHVKGSIITNLSGTDAAPVMEEILSTCNPPKVILNLANVRYLDSYSFNWVIRLMKESERKGGSFAISDPNKDILSLFELSSFGKAVPVYLTEKDAREALTSGNDAARIANN